MNELIIADRVRGATHNLPDAWLLSRLVPWLFVESNGSDWWTAVLLADGKVVTKSHPETYTPPEDRQLFAKHILNFLNRECSHGGAWVVAWIDKGRRFYLLWKDKDGDIQIPIECDQGWWRIKGWDLEAWGEHAEQAWAVWKEWHDNLEMTGMQTIKLAQGERPRQ